MAQNKKGMSAGKKVAVGAGLVAATAGAYYFLGPKGKQHQKQAKALASKVEKKVEQKVKKASGPIVKKAKSQVRRAIKKVSRK